MNVQEQKDNKAFVDMLLRSLLSSNEVNVAHMDIPICRTPTGRRRELLTEANIHLMEASRKLNGALRED